MGIHDPAEIVVLIVEDEPVVRMIAVETVAGAGFVAVDAADADEAVRILELRCDIRIVFTDVDMPGSMDGLELAAAVRGRWPPIEIVVASGHHNVCASELPERSIFLAKPYKPEQVLATLRQLAA